MSFAPDGRNISPSAETLEQQRIQNEAARVKIAAQRQQADQEAARAREQIEAAERARVTEEMRVMALSQWSAAGGTAAEFKDAWPRLRLQMLEQRALDAQAAEQTEIERRIQSYGGRF